MGECAAYKFFSEEHELFEEERVCGVNQDKLPLELDDRGDSAVREWGIGEGLIAVVVDLPGVLDADLGEQEVAEEAEHLHRDGSAGVDVPEPGVPVSGAAERVSEVGSGLWHL